MTNPPPPEPRSSPLYVGIDLGTSGCRAIAINRQARPVCNIALGWPAPTVNGARVEQDAGIWWQTLQQLLARLSRTIPAGQIQALCLDGTSGTVLLADEQGRPLAPALMYNDGRAVQEAKTLSGIAPPNSAVHSASAGLAKLLWLKQQSFARQARYFLHQADWINGLLGGVFGVSDVNNALKTGYDPVHRHWPGWLNKLDIPAGWLPRVLPPGTPIGTVRDELASKYGFAAGTRLLAGTTDSTAAVMATGAGRPGEAVTSLGSTLVLKVISDKPVFDAAAGVYSQPYGRHWLVGGGSNSGGKVLRDFFSDAQMQAMQGRLAIDKPTGLDYYPLPQIGERFPINDPAMAPRLTPRPANDVQFFQGLLEGIARIEQQGYEKLHRLGAPYPVSVRSVGGGANNEQWTTMRQRLLNVPMLKPEHTDAAYGVALLAKEHFEGDRT